MDPMQYLAAAQASMWIKPLPESELEGLDEQQKGFVRTMERVAIQEEFVALADIICNCTNKYQFAKTYRVLRKEGNRTLAEMGSARVEGLSPRTQALVRQITASSLNAKFSIMADWFTKAWHENIESYAGKEGASGCVVAFLLLLASIAAVSGLVAAL